MSRSRTVVPLVAVVVGLFVVGGWLLLRPPRPSAIAEQKPGDPPSPEPRPHKLRFHSSFVSGSAYLVRVKQGALGITPAEFWVGLFENMSHDPATVELLRRLFGGLRVQLVVLKAQPAADDPVLEAKPGPGFDVVIRVCNRGEHRVQAAQGNGKTGAVPIEYLVGTLSAGCVIDADPPADAKSGAAVGDAAALPPDPFEALKVAIEDYLLRQDTGWQGVYVGSFGEQKEFDRVAECEKQSGVERRKERWRIESGSWPAATGTIWRPSGSRAISAWRVGRALLASECTDNAIHTRKHVRGTSAPCTGTLRVRFIRLPVQKHSISHLLHPVCNAKRGESRKVSRRFGPRFH